VRFVVFEQSPMPFLQHFSTRAASDLQAVANSYCALDAENFHQLATKRLT
jgi:hypothetical protein